MSSRVRLLQWGLDLCDPYMCTRLLRLDTVPDMDTAAGRVVKGAQATTKGRANLRHAAASCARRVVHQFRAWTGQPVCGSRLLGLRPSRLCGGLGHAVAGASRSARRTLPSGGTSRTTAYARRPSLALAALFRIPRGARRPAHHAGAQIPLPSPPLPRPLCRARPCLNQAGAQTVPCSGLLSRRQVAVWLAGGGHAREAVSPPLCCVRLSAARFSRPMCC